MKKIFKSRIFLVILTAIITTSIIGVSASILYQASEIGFTPKNSNWKVNNLESALNDLYNNAGSSSYNLEGFIKIFNYTGNAQTFVAPSSGKYKIELWGASGGPAKASFSGGYCPNCYGLGGYTKGEIDLKKGETLYVYVGEKGKEAILGSSNITEIAYNGGGAGAGASDGDDAGGSGGGATDIRLKNGNWNSSESLASRIMVAGAGAGANVTGNNTTSPKAGHGGGLSGVGDLYRWKDIKVTNLNLHATQIAGYSFGQGGNAVLGNTSGGSGGGSGYYGGKADTNTNITATSGGGGSSFISGYKGCVAIKSKTEITPRNDSNGNECTLLTASNDSKCSEHYSGKIFTNAVMKAGNENMPTHDGLSTMTGNDGNGFAKITCLGNSN